MTIVDGYPSNDVGQGSAECSGATGSDVGRDDIELANVNSYAAGIRCCSTTPGDLGISECDSVNCKMFTYAEAASRCLALGYRLCTATEPVRCTGDDCAHHRADCLSNHQHGTKSQSNHGTKSQSNRADWVARSMSSNCRECAFPIDDTCDKCAHTEHLHDDRWWPSFLASQEPAVQHTVQSTVRSRV
eukprot:gene38948-biopygen29108